MLSFQFCHCQGLTKTKGRDVCIKWCMPWGIQILFLAKAEEDCGP